MTTVRIFLGSVDAPAPCPGATGAGNTTRGVARLRIAGALGHDLCRRRVVGRDDRRRLGRTGIAVIAPVGIGAGGAEHGATDDGERGGEAATPRARRVVIRLVFMRLERHVVLVGVLGLLSVVLAAIRAVVVVVLALLVLLALFVVVLALLVLLVLLVVVLALLGCPELWLVMQPTVGVPTRGLQGRRLGVSPVCRIARSLA